MNKYILDPADQIRVLPPRGDEGALIELLCERTVIYFDLSQLEALCRMEQVPSENGSCTALCFRGPDILLGKKHQVCVPENRNDFQNFQTELFRYLTEKDLPTEAYIKDSCDQTGSHHRH